MAFALRMLGAGIVLGVIGSWAAGQGMASVLFGVPTLHVPAVAGAALVVTAVSLVACLLPVRRASRLDPMIALRAE